MNTADLPLLPLGTSDFATLRMRGQIYVDKTALIYKLASKPEKFFLSRPRRFGKSLLISTFESLFKYGIRDFEGLAIENLWKDDGQYLVARLDLSEVKEFDTLEEFREEFCGLLASEFGRLGFCYDENSRLLNINLQLSNWFKTLPPTSLVLLIDEYDAPLTACLSNENLFNQVRSELSRFYSRIKSNDRMLRFMFMTGITKFSRASIFSELNNLTDISLLSKYGTLLGYTRDEVETCFGAYLEQAAEVQKMSSGKLMERLTEQYDGFCFSKDPGQRVFAPWSLLKFLSFPENGFENYWFESGGRPAALRQYLKSHSLGNPEGYADQKSIELSELSGSSDFETLSDVGLLAQTGYLTIRRIVGTTAYLDYPNAEVRTSMARLYIGLLLKGKTAEQAGAENAAARLAKASPEEVFELFNRFFRSLDYQNYPVRDEASVRAFVQAFLAGAGLDPKAEVHNFRGRSDLEVRAGHRLWVFEFKVARAGESAEAGLREAVEQISSKAYGLQHGGLELIRMALVFSTEEKQFVEWAKVEQDASPALL